MKAFKGDSLDTLEEIWTMLGRVYCISLHLDALMVTDCQTCLKAQTPSVSLLGAICSDMTLSLTEGSNEG